MPAEHHRSRPTSRHRLDDPVIASDDLQDVQELALVFVDALHLEVEEGSGFTSTCVQYLVGTSCSYLLPRVMRLFSCWKFGSAYGSSARKAARSVTHSSPMPR